jgi:hypothetical protein
MIADDAPLAAALEVTCKVCDTTAMRMQLFEPVNGYDRPHLTIDGFLNHIETVVDVAAFTPLKTHLAARDIVAVYELNRLWMPCYCPTCDAIYCRDHWATETLFDEGFYDCIRGTCPSGHTRTVDD